MTNDSLIDKAALDKVLKSLRSMGFHRDFTDTEAIQLQCIVSDAVKAYVKESHTIAAMGRGYGAGRSSDLKPDAMGVPVSDKGDNLAPPARASDTGQPINEKILRRCRACGVDEGMLHKADCPALPSEISVISILDDAKKDYANFKKFYPDDEHCFYLIGFEIPQFLEYLRAYYLREHKPVSVSLEKCAAALHDAAFGMNAGMSVAAQYINDTDRKYAKAVLDAAGVKYVD